MQIFSRTSTTVLSALLLAAVACGGTGNSSSSANNGPGGDGRFNIGHPASDSLIAAMNYDVGSAGAELPEGSGTVAEGAVLYAAQCAQCHGVNGEGVPPAFPQLSGRDPKGENFKFATDPKLARTIGNYWPYATTLFDYIKRAMPLTAPGSLTDNQIYALTAYLLAKDHVVPDTITMNAATLRSVRMPYQDRFVPDDRRAGAVK